MINFHQPNINLSSRQRPPQQALRQLQMQNTLGAPQNFTISATGPSNISNMEPNTLNPNPTHYQPLQAGLPSTGNMITSQAQRISSTNAPSSASYNLAIQQKLMGDIRKRLEEKIPESGFQHKPYVFSEDDFKMKMKAYLALNDRETPVNTLDDFPADAETQRRLVQEIVEAMLNREKNSIIDPEARLPLARIRKLSPFEIDLMAWNVLFETRDVHRGKISLPSWGKDWPWEEFSSFSERFEAVKKALYHCKAMVSSLFDEVFVKRLPLNPSAEFSRKTSNQRLNGKRKRDLEIAKGAKQDGFVPSNLRHTSLEPVTHNQQEVCPASTVATFPQDPRQASQRDLDTSLQLPQFFSDQDHSMQEMSFQSMAIDGPFSNEELENLLNLPGYFDTELGVWKDQYGKIMDFSSF